MVKKSFDVPETHVTGPLISRRLISTVWEGEKRMKTLQRYDEIRVQMSSERREKAGSVMDNSEYEEPMSTGVIEQQFLSPPKQDKPNV